MLWGFETVSGVIRLDGVIDMVDLAACARLREFRIKTGLSRQELADKLGVTMQLVWSIESDRRNLSKALIDKIKKEFCIDIEPATVTKGAIEKQLQAAKIEIQLLRKLIKHISPNTAA